MKYPIMNVPIKRIGKTISSIQNVILNAKDIKDIALTVDTAME
jgi:hypothetical protein